MNGVPCSVCGALIPREHIDIPQSAHCLDCARLISAAASARTKSADFAALAFTQRKNAVGLNGWRQKAALAFAEASEATSRGYRCEELVAIDSLTCREAIGAELEGAAQ